MNFIKVAHYKHEISLVKDAKPNQEVEVVRYNHEFVVTVIVITEFDYMKRATTWYVEIILVSALTLMNMCSFQI